MTVVSDEVAAPLRGGALRRLTSVGRLPPLVWAVIASRLIVLGAGVLGALALGRERGWAQFDPTRVSSSLGSVGDALTAASVRWDSIHYLSIAEQGYKPAGDTAFFPFYPLLIHVLSWVVRSDVLAGLLISVVSFAVALVLVHRIAREELGERAAKATVLLMALAPLSFFFTSLYTESLFLALSTATFYLARCGRLKLACVVAACAALTHVEGILLTAPLAFTYWESRVRTLAPRRLVSADAAALLLPALALVGLSVYLHAIGFDWLAWLEGSHARGSGHMMVVSSAVPSVFHRTMAGPIITIWLATEAGLSGLWQTLHGAVPITPVTGGVFSVPFQNLVYLAVLVISLFAMADSWRRLPPAYAIYATLVIILFTTSVVNIIPLRAFDRYMLCDFPLWMSAAAWLQQRRLLHTALQLSVVLLVFYTVEVTRWVMIA